MKKFAQNLAALVKVKTIVTLVVIVVFSILSLRGDIAPDNVMYVVTSVIAFYFGTQHEQKVASVATTTETVPVAETVKEGEQNV